MGTMQERLGKPVSRRDTRAKNHSAAVSEEELKQFEQGWTNMMVKIWTERINMLRINDSGALRSSMSAQALLEGAKKTIQHSFLAYGKYVDDGTGREFGSGYTDSLGRSYDFNRQSNGTLPFLTPGGEDYRREHGLDKPKKVGPAWGGRVAGGKARKPQEWFYRKFYASRMVLNEVERSFYGQEYKGMMATALDELFGQTRILL